MNLEPGIKRFFSFIKKRCDKQEAFILKNLQSSIGKFVYLI